MYWMKHPIHGEMPAQDKGEVERLKVHGWDLLNEGEAPPRGTKIPEPLNEQDQAAASVENAIADVKPKGKKK